MKVKVYVVNAFECRGTGGNPAGVVLDADGLSAQQRQGIAAAARLSETAFVSRSSFAAIRLEFFTPTRQIAHCGHATIATFSYLRQIGRLSTGASSKETIDGRREILIDSESVFMEQSSPVYIAPERCRPGVTLDRIQASIGASRSALVAEYSPIVCSTGNRFLLVPVQNAESLQKLRPDMKAIQSICEDLDVIGYYVWTSTPGEFRATTRMFAPLYGIDEEAATGTAAGPLGCYLYDHCGVMNSEILIEQGAWMVPTSRSRLVVNLQLEGGNIRRLFVGGAARHERTLEVSLPSDGL